MSRTRRFSTLKACYNEIRNLHNILSESYQENYLADLRASLLTYEGIKNSSPFNSETFITTANKIINQIETTKKTMGNYVISDSLAMQMRDVIPALDDLRILISADVKEKTGMVLTRDESQEQLNALNEQAGKSQRKDSSEKAGFFSFSFSKGSIGIALAVVGALAAFFAGPPGWVIGLAVGFGIAGFGAGWGIGNQIDNRKASSSFGNERKSSGGSSVANRYLYENIRSNTPRSSQHDDFIAPTSSSSSNASSRSTTPLPYDSSSEADSQNENSPRNHRR